VGRIVLGIAPSDSDVVYALYANGNSGAIEADLWRYDVGLNSWTDFSSTLPDEPGGNLGGNDPFAVQGGYDLEVIIRALNLMDLEMMLPMMEIHITQIYMIWYSVLLMQTLYFLAQMEGFIQLM